MAYKMKYKGYIGKGKSPMRILGMSREEQLDKQHEDKIKKDKQVLEEQKLTTDIAELDKRFRDAMVVNPASRNR
tara:strand:- start:1101 stop:1322 length:222 start_codon:yes stop_codon:yes gene_type:complete